MRRFIIPILIVLIYLSGCSEKKEDIPKGISSTEVDKIGIWRNIENEEDKLVITKDKYGNCDWVENHTNQKVTGICIAFYTGGKISKNELDKDSKKYFSGLDISSDKSYADQVNSDLKKIRKIIDGIENSEFKTIVSEYSEESEESGDCTSYDFFDSKFLYRVFDCGGNGYEVKKLSL